MDYSIYIIKKNTPESKLLSYAGIDRSTLRVSKWEGRRKTYGGFGRSPIEWKIVGTDKVADLCNAIIKILSNRKKLTPEEKQALARAIKTKEGIRNAKLQLQRDTKFKLLRKLAIENFIICSYPSLDKMQVSCLADSLSEKSFNSISKLVQSARQEMIEIKPIEEARKLFSEIMKIVE